MQESFIDRSLAIGVASFGVFSFSNLNAANNTKPNIIVILADDLGYHDLGFQGAGLIKTPNIDKLAKGGMVFNDGHVSASVCGPSRAGFMTGRYQQRFGYQANCPPYGKGMVTTETTIAQALKGIGYSTAAFGKWHLGDLKKHYPTNRGFDEFWGFREGSRHYFYNPNKDDRKNSSRAIEHNGEHVKFDGYLTDWLADRASDYIDKNADNPFFMYVAFNAPHAPFEAKKEDLEKFKNNVYAAMVWSLDEAVGRIVKTLEKHSLMENTMIWFFSDNGGIARLASSTPLNGTKGSLLEGGMRVPFFLHWEGKIKPGSEYNETVSSIDIFPTVFAANNVKPKTNKPLDGVNILPYITGEKSGQPHKVLTWKRQNIAAVRVGDWKLIRVDGKHYALYNLKKDLSEESNLINENPEIAENLRKRLEGWESELAEPLWTEPKKWDNWRTNLHLSAFSGERVECATALDKYDPRKKNKKKK